jgi:hypothetical protein
MWNVKAVHNCDQLLRALKLTPIKVVLVDLRDGFSKLNTGLVRAIQKYPHIQWIGLIEPQSAVNPAYAALLHAYFFVFCFY